MKYLIVEGITDIAFIKYICVKSNIINNYDDFKLQKASSTMVDTYKYNDLYIINLKGKDNLEYTLTNILKPLENKISKISIIQDADNDFETSLKNVKTTIKNSKISKIEIPIYLTPNNKNNGDLETLLLSTLKNNDIINCFDDYEDCLKKENTIYEKALNKGKLYAYTMYSQSGENLHKPQDSFMYKYNSIYKDTNLWNLKDDNFKSIVNFIKNIFQ